MTAQIGTSPKIQGNGIQATDPVGTASRSATTPSSEVAVEGFKLPGLVPQARREFLTVAMTQELTEEPASMSDEPTPQRQAPAPRQALEYPENVRIFGATRQNQAAQIGTNSIMINRPDGTQAKHNLSVYTDRLLVGLMINKTVDSLEEAHTQAGRQARNNNEAVAPVAMESKRKPVWTRSAEIDPDRAVIALVGARIWPGDDSFAADAVAMQELASTQLGVDPKKFQMLLGGSIEQVEAQFTQAAERGSKHLLVYYSGHGVIDEKGHSLKQPDGRIYDADWNRDVSDQDHRNQKRVRGTDSEQQGADRGGLVMRRNTEGREYTEVMSEERFQQILKKYADKFETVTVVLDTDHTGAFLPKR